MRDIAPPVLATIAQDVTNVAGSLPAGESRTLIYEDYVGARRVVVKVTVHVPVH